MARLKPLYEPKPDRKLRVAVLFSGGASALRHLVERDPHYGRLYEVVGALTDRPDASGIAFCRQRGIPVKALDFRAFLKERGASFRDWGARRAYFARVVEALQAWAPDVLLLSGFLLVITEPLLSAYRFRIVNVHPADLTIADERGRRKYVGLGLDVVRRAIEAGEPVTRSTVHLVTEEVDGGPVLVLSEPLPVEPGVRPEEHQERMKWACDGPAVQEALELIATGRVLLDSDTGRVAIALERDRELKRAPRGSRSAGGLGGSGR